MKNILVLIALALLVAGCDGHTKPDTSAPSTTSQAVQPTKLAATGQGAQRPEKWDPHQDLF